MRIDRRIKTSPRRIYASTYRAARLKIIATPINPPLKSLAPKNFRKVQIFDCRGLAMERLATVYIVSSRSKLLRDEIDRNNR